MGQGASVGLTQRDVEEVIASSGHVFTQEEVETMYWRFRSLDRGRKGFVTAEELLAIPELSINPLAQRIVRMLDGCNFTDFVRFLSNFSQRANPTARAHFIFEVYDVDGDGVISREDLSSMLRYLTGSQLSEQQREALLNQCFKEAGKNATIDFDTLCKHVGPSFAEDMVVKVPTRF